MAAFDVRFIVKYGTYRERFCVLRYLFPENRKTCRMVFPAQQELSLDWQRRQDQGRACLKAENRNGAGIAADPTLTGGGFPKKRLSPGAVASGPEPKFHPFRAIARRSRRCRIGRAGYDPKTCPLPDGHSETDLSVFLSQTAVHFLAVLHLHRQNPVSHQACPIVILLRHQQSGSSSARRLRCSLSSSAKVS